MEGIAPLKYLEGPWKWLKPEKPAVLSSPTWWSLYPTVSFPSIRSSSHLGAGHVGSYCRQSWPVPALSTYGPHGYYLYSILWDFQYPWHIKPRATNFRNSFTSFMAIFLTKDPLIILFCYFFIWDKKFGYHFSVDATKFDFLTKSVQWLSKVSGHLFFEPFSKCLNFYTNSITWMLMKFCF